MAKKAPPMGAYMRSQLIVKLPYPEKRFDGLTIIVTGSNSGMGLEAARHFVRLGAAKVILAVRSLERGQAAAESIASSTKLDGVAEVWQLDLASYASVEKFAAKVETLDRLDVVIENAGILTNSFSTAEDNESTITVNVVSTIFLALLLLPKLRETSTKFDKDVVLSFTGSFVHWMTHFPERTAESILQECASETRSNMEERYDQSITHLLCVLIKTQVLRLQADGTIRCACPRRGAHAIQEAWPNHRIHY